MFAASQGFQTVVQLLLEASADIKQADKNDNTAITLAASENHPEVVEQLTAEIARRAQEVQRAREAAEIAVQQARAAAEVTAQQAADELWQEEEAREGAAGGGGSKGKSKGKSKSKSKSKPSSKGKK